MCRMWTFRNRVWVHNARNCVCVCVVCIFERFGPLIPQDSLFLSWFFTAVWMSLIGYLVSHLWCMYKCITINNMSKSIILKRRTKSLFRHSWQILFSFLVKSKWYCKITILRVLLRIWYSCSRETHRKKYWSRLIPAIKCWYRWHWRRRKFNCI